MCIRKFLPYCCTYTNISMITAVISNQITYLRLKNLEIVIIVLNSNQNKGV